MVWFLFTETKDEPPGNLFVDPLAAELICGITTAGFHVVLVELNSASRHLLGGDVENRLGNSGSVTYLTRVLQWAERLLGEVIVRLVPGVVRVRDEKLRHKQADRLVELVCRRLSQMHHSQISEFFDEQAILTTATSNGIVEIVTRCLEFFPDIIGPMVNDQSLFLFQVAIEHRREKIFSLLRENTSRSMTWASWKVESENTILHLAAKLPPSSQLKCVSGSALQIQRELQWFKEVENFASPVLREIKNIDKKTPWELFMDDHKELVEKGEKWMKDTSTSCMVVATLIATVVFAAAFTVPGGNDNNNGIPIFLKHKSFMMFAISNALALFSATTSLLMFLSILTARYAEEDFLTSLPKRLILGLASLFFAIAAMMIAFSAALSIVLNERLKRVYIPITLVACFPVTIFAMLQLPLFIQMFQSTYGSGIFHRRSNLRL
ncbi:hypothetical protein L1049_010693 [Liquidambar formosana]|uniref:PGG domain-containing protein n=1 Tax=Liquidambar formosana TaxID=63359 RepID=A0AAP0NAP6_LIQFO